MGDTRVKQRCGVALADGAPSIQVGSDPTTALRYYYVSNSHADLVNLVNASGTQVATYAYDPWGVVTINTESFTNGWHNPYLYDGRDGVRYDTETGLYWMSVRAYDPTLGRFIARGRRARAVVPQKKYRPDVRGCRGRTGGWWIVAGHGGWRQGRSAFFPV